MRLEEQDFLTCSLEAGGFDAVVMGEVLLGDSTTPADTVSAPASAISSAAEEDSPAPAGTAESMNRSAPARGATARA